MLGLLMEAVNHKTNKKKFEEELHRMMSWPIDISINTRLTPLKESLFL
jgi:hypothetical protein